ncbi:MAG TPA: CusA/CzcA family heavy metal efflux RND transporter, partial [Flavobacteriaceae bacterium]|nr:CusA/CzcA family heavy metal efflux RND transporter [Flavobacteriaceae bacterium]
IGGKAISQIFSDDRVYDFTCRYKEDSRNTPEKIRQLTLTNVDGVKIPLAQVADVKLNTGESTITREMNKRHLTIKLNLRDRDLSSFLKEAQNKIEQNIDYDHSQYHIKWSGQFENQDRAYKRLSVIIPIAILVMFILLYAAFGKLRQALLLIGIIPLAIFGGMLALNVRGMTLNVSSAVGFIALFGVAIQNGVIMISQINLLKNKGMELSQAVIEGTKNRFRPVLMTATVAILGLLPASLETGIGSDVQRPLATVIVYGLLFSTIITLFALPALYYMIEKKWGKDSVEKSVNQKQD